MINRVDELRIFVQVVDSGSLTTAARALSLSIHQVSRKLKALEERVGHTLIHRSTRSLALSDDGERLYNGAQRVLAEIAATEQALSSPSTLRGTLRVALPSMMSRGPWLAAMRDLLNTHPELTVDIFLIDSGIDVVASGFDLAIVVGTPPPSSLIGVSLGAVEAPLAATPAYLDQHGRPEIPADLSSHRVLRFVAKRATTHWTLVHRETGETTTAPVHGPFASADGHLLASALLEGLGIGIASADWLLDAIDEGRLEQVLHHWTFDAFPVYALIPPNRRGDPRVRAVLACCRGTMGSRVMAPKRVLGHDG